MSSSSSSSVKDRGFYGEVFSCIERALSSILGESAKHAMLHMATQVAGVSLDDLVTKPLQMMDLLHKSLGDSGYSIIETAVIREIRRKFQLREDEASTLHATVELAKAKFLGKNFSTE